MRSVRALLLVIVFCVMAIPLYANPDTAPGAAPGTAPPPDLAYFKDGKIFLINADGTGQRHLTNGTSPQWSADGQWIGYKSSEAPEGYLVMHHSGNEKTVVHEGNPSGWYFYGNPQWSPESNRIAYTQTTDDPPQRRLSVYDHDTGATTHLLELSESEFFGAWFWHPEDRQIFYQITDKDIVRKIGTIDIGSGERVEVDVQPEDMTFMPVAMSSPVINWSPQGKLRFLGSDTRAGQRILSEAEPFIDGARQDISLATIYAAYEAIPRNKRLQIPAAAWSNTGDRVAVALEFEQEDTHIHILDKASGSAPEYTVRWGTISPDTLPIWTPDDRSIVFSTGGCGHPEGGDFSYLHLMDTTSGGVRIVANMGRFNACAGTSAGTNFWQLNADGTQAAFTVTGNNPAAHPTDAAGLYIVDLMSGRDPVLLDSDGDMFYAPQWRPTATR